MDLSSHSSLNFDLAAFEATIRHDPAVLGLLYTGSLGRGTADRYSDLDMVAWVADDALDDARASLLSILEALGDVQFSIFRMPASMRAYVCPDWRRVELDLLGSEDLRPAPKFSASRVIKDTDGILGGLVAESPPEEVQASWEQVRAMIEEAIDSQIYLALHNARGASWSATGEISYRLSELHTLLARLRGYRSYGFRFVETRLSEHEQNLLEAAWPASAEQAEVRRAARALWAWTCHVWSEAEGILGRPLEITIDDDQFAAAVDRIYERRASR